jgi:hypothetical protein
VIIEGRANIYTAETATKSKPTISAARNLERRCRLADGTTNRAGERTDSVDAKPKDRVGRPTATDC